MASITVDRDYMNRVIAAGKAALEKEGAGVKTTALPKVDRSPYRKAKAIGDAALKKEGAGIKTAPLPEVNKDYYNRLRGKTRFGTPEGISGKTPGISGKPEEGRFGVEEGRFTSKWNQFKGFMKDKFNPITPPENRATAASSDPNNRSINQSASNLSGSRPGMFETAPGRQPYQAPPARTRASGASPSLDYPAMTPVQRKTGFPASKAAGMAAAGASPSLDYPAMTPVKRGGMTDIVQPAPGVKKPTKETPGSAVNPSKPGMVRKAVTPKEKTTMEKYKEMLGKPFAERQAFADDKNVIEQIRGTDVTYVNPANTRVQYGTALEAALGVGKEQKQRNYADEKALAAHQRAMELQGLRNKGGVATAQIHADARKATKDDDIMALLEEENRPHMESTDVASKEELENFLAQNVDDSMDAEQLQDLFRHNERFRQAYIKYNQK